MFDLIIYQYHVRLNVVLVELYIWTNHVRPNVVCTYDSYIPRSAQRGSSIRLLQYKYY